MRKSELKEIRRHLIKELKDYEGKPVKLDIKIGNPAKIAMNKEPTRVKRLTTLLIYFVVSTPGLTPGI